MRSLNVKRCSDLMQIAVTAILLVGLVACGGGGTDGTSAATNNAAPVMPVVPDVPVVPVVPAATNLTAIVVDSGPVGASGVINAPYVTVTICQPGTSNCQTIDHVLLDTGSFGLRIMASAIGAGFTLPAVTVASGAEAAECGQFVSGYTWGSVKRADINIGGEVALALPIQLIGDTTSNFATVPTACKAVGKNLGTVAGFGSNGVLGVGVFKEDCGTACVNSIPSASYYACTSGSCVGTRMPLASQVSNPVASFAVNKNGVLVSLPTVAIGGARTLSGSLIFGIDTQSNNAIGTAAVYATDGQGNFKTIYKGVSLTSSFLDTGSNGLFFDDTAMVKCTTAVGFYCPATIQSLSAINVSADGMQSGTVNFTVENVEKRSNGVYAMSIGGQSGSSSSSKTFNWGLPFFFGRKVYVAIEAAPPTSKGAGPFWAY